MEKTVLLHELIVRKVEGSARTRSPRGIRAVGRNRSTHIPSGFNCDVSILHRLPTTTDGIVCMRAASMYPPCELVETGMDAAIPEVTAHVTGAEVGYKGPPLLPGSVGAFPHKFFISV